MSMFILETQPVLTTEQIRAADAWTIEHEPISSIDLMERASRAFVDELLATYGEPWDVHIYCGTGNNGGDGLAIARMLLEMDCDVYVLVVGDIEQGTEDFKTNLERYNALVKEKQEAYETDDAIDEAYKAREISYIEPGERIWALPTEEEYLLIDALIGSGLNRPLEGQLADMAKRISICVAWKVSVDIPSGMFADKANAPEDIIFKADQTITFQVPRQAFLLPKTGPKAGRWSAVDIGLSKKFIEEQETNWYCINRLTVPPREKFSHKGNYGHALLMAGSKGMIGAAIFAAQSCLRSGVGKLTVACPAIGYNIIQNNVPEAMVKSDKETDVLANIPGELDGYDAIGFGPGVGTHKITAQLMQMILENFKGRIVLDADAINLLAKYPALWPLIKGRAILTPHPGEFKRLVGEYDDDWQAIEMLRKFAMDNEVCILLKGAHTAIAGPDGKVWFNMTGNPGMSTAGSGDVLTGIITALACRTDDITLAAQAGVFMHGLAGDLGAVDLGYEGLIASDIIDYLPRAILKLS